ncbi:MAG: hypothetical protein O9353_11920 [Bacteroidia bacterium]|nr:hypothetical protein [Bacteroidia bacterium]
MKKYFLSISLSLAFFQFTSCTSSETISAPKQFDITFDNNSNDSIKLFLHQGAGKYDEILPVENIYLVNIPEMRGGYSSFFGIKFNKHTPEEFKVVKIMKGEKTIKEFSIMEIEQFKKNEKGNYLVTY